MNAKFYTSLVTGLFYGVDNLNEYCMIYNKKKDKKPNLCSACDSLRNFPTSPFKNNNEWYKT